MQGVESMNYNYSIIFIMVKRVHPTDLYPQTESKNIEMTKGFKIHSNQIMNAQKYAK